jgi:hypothetical protein
MEDNYVGQVIYYFAARYKLAIIVSIILAVILVSYGFINGEWIYLAVGVFCFVFAGLFTMSVKDKIKPGAIALARKGDLLIGNELRNPLPIAETTFEIKSDYEGGWWVILHHNNSSIRLGAGGWKVADRKLLTKDLVEKIFLSYGLKEV